MVFDVKNIGLRTEIMIAEMRGLVENRGSYRVIRTPENPHFWYGHALVFSEGPQENMRISWESDFSREFDPNIHSHRLFYIDSDSDKHPGNADFIAHGYEINRLEVLTCTQSNDAHFLLPSSEFSISRLTVEDDWKSLCEFTRFVDVADNQPYVDAPNYENFRTKNTEQNRKAVEKGRGNWWVIKHTGNIVASMGLFWDGYSGRFQAVQTHPAFRRNGLCLALLSHVMQEAFDRYKLSTLVIVPANDDVSRLYQKAGFRPDGALIDYFKAGA